MFRGTGLRSLLRETSSFPSTTTLNLSPRVPWNRHCSEFDDASIAAVAIPFVNVNYGSDVLKRAPAKEGTFVTEAYIGTAHAIRRDIFLIAGGYREFLFHFGEEEDLCIRMLDVGKFTRLGNADPIHHYVSPKRDVRRMDIYGTRNKILFSWYNVPMPYLLAHMPAVTANSVIYGFKIGRPLGIIQGVIRGLAACLSTIDCEASGSSGNLSDLP